MPFDEIYNIDETDYWTRPGKWPKKTQLHSRQTAKITIYFSQNSCKGLSCSVGKEEDMEWDGENQARTVFACKRVFCGNSLILSTELMSLRFSNSFSGCLSQVFLVWGLLVTQGNSLGRRVHVFWQVRVYISKENLYNWSS